LWMGLTIGWFLYDCQCRFGDYLHTRKLFSPKKKSAPAVD
jgi:hypothetical protein